MTTAVTFGLLGPIAVRATDGSLSYPTGREARVLAATLLSLNEAIPVSQLIDVVWPSKPPASPEPALHNVVYRLRRLLEEAETDAVVDKSPDGYSLRADRWELDSTRFESMVTQAESQPPDEARRTLTQALGLWRGEPFGSRTNGVPAFRAEAERLTAMRWMAIEDRIYCDLHTGRYRDLVPELVGLTTRAPIRETLWAQLMAALYLSGQRGRAIGAYRRAQDHMSSELGIEPGRSLQELAQAIIDQDDKAVAASTTREIGAR